MSVRLPRGEAQGAVSLPFGAVPWRRRAAALQRATLSARNLRPAASMARYFSVSFRYSRPTIPPTAPLITTLSSTRVPPSGSGAHSWCADRAAWLPLLPGEGAAGFE